jgi:hypothetical protein
MKWRWAIAIGAYRDHDRVISRRGEAAEMAGHGKAVAAVLWMAGKKSSCSR